MKTLTYAGLGLSLLAMAGCADRRVSFRFENQLPTARTVSVTMPDGRTRDLGTVDPGESIERDLGFDKEELPGAVTWSTGDLSGRVAVTDDTDRVRIAFEREAFAPRTTVSQVDFTGQPVIVTRGAGLQSTGDASFVEPNVWREQEVGYSGQPVDVIDEVQTRETFDPNLPNSRSKIRGSLDTSPSTEAGLDTERSEGLRPPPSTGTERVVVGRTYVPVQQSTMIRTEAQPAERSVRYEGRTYHVTPADSRMHHGQMHTQPQQAQFQQQQQTQYGSTSIEALPPQGQPMQQGQPREINVRFEDRPIQPQQQQGPGNNMNIEGLRDY